MRWRKYAIVAGAMLALSGAAVGVAIATSDDGDAQIRAPRQSCEERRAADHGRRHGERGRARLRARRNVRGGGDATRR